MPWIDEEDWQACVRAAKQAAEAVAIIRAALNWDDLPKPEADEIRDEEAA